MVLVIIAALFCIVLGLWALITNTVSLSRGNAILCKNVHLLISAVGAVGAVLTFIIFNLSGAGASEGEGFVFGSFNTIALAQFVFVGIGFLVTVLSSVLKTRLRGLIIAIVPMWAFINLFVTFMGAYWLSFSGRGAAVAVAFFGIFLSCVLSFSVFLELHERAKLLSDRRSREEIIKKRSDKRAKKEAKRIARKRLSDKKKKLRHPKK